MARTNVILRTGTAWAAAVLVTTVMASMIHTWQLQSNLIDPGVTGTAGDPAVPFFITLALPVLGLLGITRAAAFMRTSWLALRRPKTDGAASPLADSGASASAAAIGTTLGVMHAQFPATPLSAACNPKSILLFCVAAAVGSIVFGWLKPR